MFLLPFDLHRNRRSVDDAGIFFLLRFDRDLLITHGDAGFFGR